MFKVILIFFLIVYIISKVGRGILRILFSKAINQQRHGFDTRGQDYEQRTRQRRPAGGNVNIDYNPNEGIKPKDASNFKGGDYVKYEEVD